MPVALMDTYSDQEFTEIVKNSLNFKDCLRTLGYSSDSGASTKRLKQKIKQLNIDISHYCNMQLDTTNARNPHRSDKFNNCDICGKRINYKQKRCKECAEKYGHYNTGKHKKDLPVTREELKNLIRNESFRQIGIDFKISDNGIRKWCKRYNLPFKAYEIKKIPDSDWEKI